MLVDGAADRSAGRAVDLAGIASGDHDPGVVWTQECGEGLNVNLVRFEAGEGVGVHRNDEVDVVFMGVSGSGEVVVDEEKLRLEPGLLVYVPKGSLRAIRSDFAGSPTSPSTGGGGRYGWPRGSLGTSHLRGRDRQKEGLGA